MSSPIDSLIARYQPATAIEFENALKEILQEIALTGLARAHFFDKAAFYGGTALRIFHRLPRFSEDLDFTLISSSSKSQSKFSLIPYFKSMKQTLGSFGFEVEIEKIEKKNSKSIESAFLKANTKIHFLKIEPGKTFADKIHSDKKMTIKLEVDTTPSLGFETEVKVLHPPITSAVKVLKVPYLFAGKMHALLFRKWKTRIKGRDFYDLLWYIGQQIPVSLRYLENKMKAGGEFEKKQDLTQEYLVALLEKRIKSVDFESAAKDVIAFIKDPNEILMWNKSLFLAAIQNLKTI